MLPWLQSGGEDDLTFSVLVKEHRVNSLIDMISKGHDIRKVTCQPFKG